MECREIKARRVRLGFSRAEVAAKMGLKTGTYGKKENGVNRFSEDEKLLLGKILNFTPRELNDYLFDGKLPIGCSDNADW